MIGAIIELGREIIGGIIDSQKQKRKIAAAIAENKARLALAKESHNSEWEMAALQGRDRWIRRGSFAVLSSPLIWAAIDPDGASSYFTGALDGLPDWYIQAYLGMTAAIWGLAELRRTKR